MLIRYPAHARAFLKLSRDALARFDSTDDISELMSSALQLRFGIEARLDVYLRATLKQLGQEGSPIAEYRASKLLKQLVKANPRASGGSRVRITSDETGPVTHFDYTPVSPELAKLHGTLGELLHFKFRNLSMVMGRVV